jgi:hypothetical protein
MDLTQTLNFVSNPANVWIMAKDFGIILGVAGALGGLVYSIPYWIKRSEIREYRKQEKQEEQRKELYRINLLNKNISHLKRYELNNYLEELPEENEIPEEYKEILVQKRIIAENAIIISDQETTMNENNTKVNFLHDEIAELGDKQQEIWLHNRDNATEKEDILKNLKADEKTVIKKKGLTKKEIKALLEDGFKHANEFCVFEKKILSVLVKPRSNHSITHAFLVWSVSRLVHSIKGVRAVMLRSSAEADVTFEFNGKTYAIEIETGVLPRKKSQASKKVKDLNKKYSKRWFFVVSHRKFLKDYKKLGPSTCRNQVQEKLVKMLEI